MTKKKHTRRDYIAWLLSLACNTAAVFALIHHWFWFGVISILALYIVGYTKGLLDGGDMIKEIYDIEK